MVNSNTSPEWGYANLLMVEFPAGTPPFNVEMAAELMRLHDVGLIRVLDLLVVLKDGDGQARGWEAMHFDGPDLQGLERHLPRVLAADDVDKLAGALEPGTTAAVVVWADTWVAQLLCAVGRSGGIAAGPERGSESTSGCDVDTAPWCGRSAWEPLSPERRRRGVLRGSVTRTAGFPCRSSVVPGRGPAR